MTTSFCRQLRRQLWFVPRPVLPDNEDPVALIGYTEPSGTIDLNLVKQKYSEKDPVVSIYHIALSKVFTPDRKVVSAGEFCELCTNEFILTHRISSEVSHSGSPILPTADTAQPDTFIGVRMSLPSPPLLLLLPYSLLSSSPLLSFQVY